MHMFHELYCHSGANRMEAAIRLGYYWPKLGVAGESTLVRMETFIRKDPWYQWDIRQGDWDVSAHSRFDVTPLWVCRIDYDDDSRWETRYERLVRMEMISFLMKDLLYHYIEDLQQDDLDVSSHSESVDWDSRGRRSTVRLNEKVDVWVGVQNGGIFGTEVCIWNEEDGQGETETALSNPRLDIQVFAPLLGDLASELESSQLGTSDWRDGIDESILILRECLATIRLELRVSRLRRAGVVF